MAEETKTIRKRVRTVETVAWICDACGKRIDTDDWIEIQEMLHWRMTGGYGSIFGDGDKISLDLCQECTKRILGGFIKVEGLLISRTLLAPVQDHLDPQGENLGKHHANDL